MVFGDLIDIWLYEGSKGFGYVKAQQQAATQFTSDQYKRYVDLYESVKTQSIEMQASLSSQLKQKVEATNKKVVFFYDEASNWVGMLLNVLRERQNELVDYIR